MPSSSEERRFLQTAVFVVASHLGALNLEQSFEVETSRHSPTRDPRFETRLETVCRTSDACTGNDIENNNSHNDNNTTTTTTATTTTTNNDNDNNDATTTTTTNNNNSNDKHNRVVDI